MNSSTPKGDKGSTIVGKDSDPGLREFIEKVGLNLLGHRRRLGLSQQEVAELIGIEPESVSRMENGVISPTLARLRQFATVYQCSVESIIGTASDLPGDLNNRLGVELKELPEADRVFVTEQAIGMARHIKASRRRILK